jgi:hypothetical protein
MMNLQHLHRAAFAQCARSPLTQGVVVVSAMVRDGAVKALSTPVTAKISPRGESGGHPREESS